MGRELTAPDGKLHARVVAGFRDVENLAVRRLVQELAVAAGDGIRRDFRQLADWHDGVWFIRLEREQMQSRLGAGPFHHFHGFRRDWFVKIETLKPTSDDYRDVA